MNMNKVKLRKERSDLPLRKLSLCSISYILVLYHTLSFSFDYLFDLSIFCFVFKFLVHLARHSLEELHEVRRILKA